MKYCTKCGAGCDDNAAFCKECGNPLPQGGQGNASTGNYQNPNQNYSQNSSQNYYQNPGQNYGQNHNYAQNGQPYTQPGNQGIAPRSIPLCILFTLITCGIYGIYWMIKINDEINLLAGEPNATSGGMVFLFSIITCGIYSFYWLYKMGERSDRIKRINGNSGLLYLLLAIFGLSIISYCLIQDTINKAV